MEYCGGGSVADLMHLSDEPLEEPQIAYICRESLKVRRLMLRTLIRGLPCSFLHSPFDLGSLLGLGYHFVTLQSTVFSYLFANTCFGDGKCIAVACSGIDLSCTPHRRLPQFQPRLATLKYAR